MDVRSLSALLDADEISDISSDTSETGEMEPDRKKGGSKQIVVLVVRMA